MNKSDSIAELLKALSVFQGSLENVEKSKSGHGYKYATLGACIDTAKPLLAANGLSVMQLMGDDGKGNSTMETVLGHSSGEYIATTCIIPIAKLAGGGANNPAQVMGASVTYIRRYQFAAIIGLAQDDDDASSATQGTPQHKQDDDKPWYNEPDYQADLQGITNAINEGADRDDIINQIANKFRISTKYRDLIKEIG